MKKIKPARAIPATFVFCAVLLCLTAARLDPGRGMISGAPGTTHNPARPPVITKMLQAAANTNTDSSKLPTARIEKIEKNSPAVIPLAKTIGNQAVAADGARYPLATYRALGLPNDPSASQPWVTNTNLTTAWDIPRGSSPTVLAIIDTGVALQHEELKNRWYTNTGESGQTTTENPSRLNCTDRALPLDKSCNLIDDDGDNIVDNESGPTASQNPSRRNCTGQGIALDKTCNLIDDDANGFTDDTHGWDFVHFDNSSQAGEANPGTTGGHHATYVAGVAAATGNNGVGIAGVDWGTAILPLQALEDEGAGYTVAVANAINYAASQHADVISLSLGSPTADPLVRQAVQAAIAKGSIVVAAAGNDGCNCMNYPANFPEVVAVGAAANDGKPASFSSYGANLDILAPGVNLYTTDWQPTNQTSAYAGGIGGTSLATPIVSGLLTRLKSIQPRASPLQLIAALTENTNRLTLPGSSARSDTLGFGMVQAAKASQRLITPYNPSILYSFTPLSMGQSLFPQSPSEVKSPGLPYQCDPGNTGSTPLYLLSKAAASFYSASTAEVQQAAVQGYTASLYNYMCLTQPIDRPATIRLMNANTEFRNIGTAK